MVDSNFDQLELFWTFQNMFFKNRDRAIGGKKMDIQLETYSSRVTVFDWSTFIRKTTTRNKEFQSFFKCRFEGTVCTVNHVLYTRITWEYWGMDP